LHHPLFEELEGHDAPDVGVLLHSLFTSHVRSSESVTVGLVAAGEAFEATLDAGNLPGFPAGIATVPNLIRGIWGLRHKSRHLLRGVGRRVGHLSPRIVNGPEICLQR
jgi:hypothetical protein